MNTDLDRQFGKRMRALREARGLSQDRVARHLSANGHPWHQSTVGKVESGRRPVRLAEASAIAAVLDVELVDLISDCSPPTEQHRRVLAVEALAEVDRVVALVSGHAARLRRELGDALRDG